MTEKVKISAVSYLNSLPFIYGIESNKELMSGIVLSKDYPAVCAEKLVKGEVDLGLIPVAEIKNIPEPYIISNYCIGAVGKVNSVFLFSDVPVFEIKQIVLDYQSRTSVNLLKILVRDYWKINVVYLPAKAGFEEEISGKKAGLIIGDRSFKYVKKYKYVYDLSEEWMKMTSLPFVFAAWVSNKKLSDSFVKQFNDALEYGLSSKGKVITDYNFQNPNSEIDIDNYLKFDISYSLDADKRKGMVLFLSLLKNI